MARPPALPRLSSRGPAPQCLCATGVQRRGPAMVALPVPSKPWPGSGPAAPQRTPECPCLPLSLHPPLPSLPVLSPPDPIPLSSHCVGGGTHTQPSWQPRHPQKVGSKGRVARWFWPLPSPSSCPGSAWNLGQWQRWAPSKPGKEGVRTPTREGVGRVPTSTLTRTALARGTMWWWRWVSADSQAGLLPS